jgi:hypothetical protein
VFGRELQQKRRCTRGMNCLITLAASVKERAYEYDEAQKLMWIQLEGLQQINQARCLTTKHCTQQYIELRGNFRNLKVSPCNCSRRSSYSQNRLQW